MFFDHGLTQVQIERIPAMLEGPQAIYRSDTHPTNMVVLTYELKAGSPIIIPIARDRQVGRGPLVLEHLPRPMDALITLKRVLKPGGTITAIEGDHGSTFFHPDSEEARNAISCQVTLQAAAGGDALIGRRLYPLLRDAGYRDVRVSPRMAYADATRPAMTDGFTRKTFTAMIESVRQRALDHGLQSSVDFDKGIAALHRGSGDDGVFCYTFFKATGRR
jgi:hypothetical protein